MNDDSFKDAAISECYKSSYRQRMGATVVHKGKMVGKGFNKVRSTGIPHMDGIHAEIDALNKTPFRYRSDSIVYVCRINRLGELMLAKPCSSCQTIMRKLGVKYVWYSYSDGWKKMIL